MVHEITRVSISVPSNRSRSGMVHGPGIGTGGVVRPLEWVIFLRGCICIYKIRNQKILTPSSPVRAPRAIHARPGVTSARPGALLSGSNFGFAVVRELLFSFAEKGCIHPTVIHPAIIKIVIHPAIIRLAVIHPTVIHSVIHSVIQPAFNHSAKVYSPGTYSPGYY